MPPVALTTMLSLRAARPWAMDARQLTALLKSQTHIVPPWEDEPATPSARVPATATGGADDASYQVRDGLAIVPLWGVMMSSAPWWAEFFGLDVCVTGDAHCAVRAAVADNAVKAIALDINSPGGEISGVAALARAVRAARSHKPVHAVVSDVCASAAYWVAAQADDIAADDTAMVGSIGVYTIHEDYSRLYGNYGVEIEVIRSGPLKGAGVAGTALTHEQRQELQDNIDGLCQLFAGAVADGRKRARADVEKWATGGAWLAKAAQKKGLIDHVEDPEDALARIVGAL